MADDDDKARADGPDQGQASSRSKQEWAKEGRFLTGMPDEQHRNRLPPGQKEVKNWPVLDLGVQPNIVPPRKWKRPTSAGLSKIPITWSLEEFMAQPQEDFVSDIHCVTQWSRFDNHWRGVSARRILAAGQAEDRRRATSLFHSYDGYTTNVKREVFEEPERAARRIPGRASRFHAITADRCAW